MNQSRPRRQITTPATTAAATTTMPITTGSTLTLDFSVWEAVLWL